MSHWPHLIITVKRAFYFVKGGVGGFKEKTNPFSTPKTKEKKLHRAKILTAKKHRLQKEFLLKRHQPPKHPFFVKLLVVGTAISRAFNPRTYTQIHTPTVVQGKRGLIEPLPCVFDMLQYFETILSSVESPWSSLQDKVYFIGCWRRWGTGHYLSPGGVGVFLLSHRSIYLIPP